MPHRLETQVPNLAHRDTLVNPASDDWHGEGQVFPPPYGETEAALTTVARGPVLRNLTLNDHRSAGPLGCHPRIREGFPRDRCLARGTRSHARVACEGPRPTSRWHLFFSPITAVDTKPKI